MKCVILQPSYIPWRGYFHQIYKTDVFVFYDDVQYDKLGWRNRNRIKTHQGTKWLSIPVTTQMPSLHLTPINHVLIDNKQPWNRKHWATLQQSYSKAPFYKMYAPILESSYRNPPVNLADFTIELTITLSRELGIENTKFLRSSNLGTTGCKTDRLIQILKTIEATHYITGPSAKEYLEENKLFDAGISLEYMVYDYPPYEQLYPPYDPFVSILDLLFMMGPSASKYIW
jgi:hypothetical protein